MKILLRTLIAIGVLTLSCVHASPSNAALNASLQAIDSDESYEEIKALDGLRDKYATSYKAHTLR
ncbi:MAG: hypothetical protein PHU41_10690, partial [Sulfuricurvum sp.]|nr:hypothetical protein [Sulfuricurvum sp.]